MPPNAQKLAPDPRGVGADDALSDVAYDKGSWFLRTLEQRFGRATFDDYLKGYFNHFAWQSITTEQMLDYMKPNLIEKYPGTMRSEEHTSELQSLMRNSYAVFCLKKKKQNLDRK